MIEEELSGKIIKIFYKVYNELGYGFLESVYQNAFLLELSRMGILAESGKRILVYYLDKPVGIFRADIVVEDKMILELKSKKTLVPAHEAQLVNYLRATDIEIGLLLNFGRRPEFKRKYFSNENKRHAGTEANREFLAALFQNDPSSSA
jgi:GxxExxY protein